MVHTGIYNRAGDKIIKNTDNTETKHNPVPETANKTRHIKTKLPWFSCLL